MREPKSVSSHQKVRTAQHGFGVPVFSGGGKSPKFQNSLDYLPTKITDSWPSLHPLLPITGEAIGFEPPVTD